MRNGLVVIGLLIHWRQIGRRFFWPHILLGMVAASFGLPVSAQSGAELNTSSETPPASSLFIGSAVRFNHLIRLQDTTRRPNFTVDYWHQHAIRTVIRHLSFTLTPQAEAQVVDELPLAVQKLALIDSLHALLTSPSALPSSQFASGSARFVDAQAHLFVVLHAKIHGIRAGPSQRFS